MAHAARTIVVALCLLGCGGGVVPTPSAAPSATPASSPVHWSYEGAEGPGRWAELSPEFALCASGQAQSPIDVGDTDPQDLADITFDYRPAPLEIVNNGHTVQVNYPAGSSISLDGATYDLLQFHFHAPSEHTLAGESAAAELHLVHRATDGRLAVVGVLLTEGDANAGLEPVFENLPPAPGPAATVPGVEVDAAALLPATRTTYRYPGSLTTPPCSEGVSWLLLTGPLAVSADQLAAFTDVIEGNNRPVQPLNDREVVEDTTP